ncbi:MAG: 6-phosphofructokinase [Bacilli bacterium]|jgi:6-phosphofructokinase 1|nr:6-phosphofructokinase [Bacilli bacterium]
MLKGNVIYGQSGGPSSAINSSALGVIEESLLHKEEIGRVFMMHHGIVGAIHDDLIEVTNEDKKELEMLAHTSGAYFGNVRYRLQPYEENPKDYEKILKTLIKYNIRYFFYNGGNDSMDTCDKMNRFLIQSGYDARVIGIPKTIDNDLEETDHTPGYGTSAKFIANAMAEIDLDNASYPEGRVIICEIMGRHAGWLTASAGLANINGYGPDLLYVPEIPFDMNMFLTEVQHVYEKKKRCLIAVSEGIVDKNGAFIFQVGKKKDSFGHYRLGGVGQVLANNIISELGLNAVAIEFSFLQRACCRLSSLQDSLEAEKIGREAVKQALKGTSGKMITIVRVSSKPYKFGFGLTDLMKVANYEKKMPRSMFNEEGDFITQEFIDYALPLIQGEINERFENGIVRSPRFKGFKS